MAGERSQALLHILSEHFHSVMKCYPVAADPVTITGGAGVWAEGAKVEIVPASTIDDEFDIHFVSISDISAADNYEFILYAGGVGSEVEIARVPFTRGSVQVDSTQLKITTPLIFADERISGALATSGGGSDTCDVKLGYHTY
jgi:hypothetical protein